MNRHIKRGFALVAASLLAVGSYISPANASPDIAMGSSLSSCTALAASEGECITYVRIGNADPMLAGIKQSLTLSGADGDAGKFIQNRKKSHPDDATQLAAEKMVSKVKPLKDKASRSDALGSVDTNEPFASMSPAPQPRNPGGLGTIEGQTLRVTEYLDYGVCDPGGCGSMGFLDVEFRMNIINNLEFVLSGDLNAWGGGPVAFQSIECQTVWDGLFNIDQVVHTWNTCSSAAYPHEPLMNTQIMGEFWSGGGLGETYHPEYALSFTWPGSPVFYGEFIGKEYKVSQSGLTYWLP